MIVYCQFCGRNLTEAERKGEPIHCFKCWRPWMGPYNVTKDVTNVTLSDKGRGTTPV